VDFIEPEDVHAIVMRFDFDVSVAWSVPLIYDFYDVDPTLAPIKSSGRSPEIRMRLDLNAHELIDGITRFDGPFYDLLFATCHHQIITIAMMPTNAAM
jgi:hypothetical protein